jgi:hypothetical protein
MADSFAAQFAAARDRYGPLAIGADPHGQVLGKWGLTDDADGLERFTDIVLSAAAGTAGLIKPQSAFQLTPLTRRPTSATARLSRQTRSQSTPTWAWRPWASSSTVPTSPARACSS